MEEVSYLDFGEEIIGRCENGERFLLTSTFTEPVVLLGVPDFITLAVARIAEDTGFHSSPRPRMEHPLMQVLVSMGPDVTVPVLISMLEDARTWVPITALFQIVKENGPDIPKDHRGRFEALRQDWLDWYERKEK